MVVLPLVWCVVGLVLLTFAADHLVVGASRVAAWLRVNPVVVGVVVIGLGTSAPEFLVAGSAAARGDAELAVGNIIGSNIINVTFVLGVAALVAWVRVESRVLAREVPLSVCAVVVFGVAVWWALGVVAAVVLVAGLLGALWLLVRWAVAGRWEDRDLAGEVVRFTDERGARWWVSTVRAVVGLAGVLVGAQVLVVNAEAVAVGWGVSPVVIGFTLVAVGTSLPELVTAVQAQRRGEPELVVGNLFGSNLFNSLAGGAVVGLSAPAHAPARVSVALIASMVLTGLLAWALLRRGLRLSRLEGAVLVGAYVVILPLVVSS